MAKHGLQRQLWLIHGRLCYAMAYYGALWETMVGYDIEFAHAFKPVFEFKTKKPAKLCRRIETEQKN